MRARVVRASVVMMGLSSFLGACAAEDESVQVTATAATTSPNAIVNVSVVDGEPTCGSLGLNTLELTIAPVATGTYSLDSVGNTLAVTANAAGTFDFRASLSIDAVIVPGVGSSNVYKYAPFQVTDQALKTPDGSPLRSFSVCWGYELRTFKSASTSFKRTYGWAIEKAAEKSSLTLAAGETYEMPFTVDVGVAGQTDSDFTASGQILIGNPSPLPAEITSVEDTFLPNGQSVPVDCGVSFPHILPSGTVLTCTYRQSLDQPLNGTGRLTVKTNPTGVVKGHVNIATVNFANAAIDSIDECVDVTDDKYGALGSVCANDGTMEFSYVMDVGPYSACGTHTFTNTATFTGRDSGATGSDSADVTSEVACPTEPGCTLTQGYWKTHSSYGPAPYDDAWAALPNGANTTFFASGASYYSVLRSNSSNAYYKLAQQYIAAELNGLNGAETDAVAVALAEAQSIFSTYTPAQINNLPRKSPVRDRLDALTDKLEDYNEGKIGPGHCHESKECGPGDKLAKKKKIVKKVLKLLKALFQHWN
jgi:hypothetical protein